MFIEGCPKMGGPESYFVPPCSGKVEKTNHSLWENFKSKRTSHEYFAQGESAACQAHFEIIYHV